MREVAILDYGGQYVQNIRRAFREMSIAAEIVSPDSTLDQLRESAGIVLSGGPYSVYQDAAPSVDTSLLRSGKPILGLCYGHQLIAHGLGGDVSGGKAGEYGFAEIEITHQSPIFRGIESPQIAWMSHGDEVTKLPKGFVSLASTQGCPNAAMAHTRLPIYGLQFHPEVSHTPKGWEMLANFAHEVCGLEIGTWDPDSYIKSKIEEIREEVRNGTAMVAVSGGVDSTVAAVLAKRALGDHLVTVHVDHGFMREGESERVIQELGSLGLNPLLVEASGDFYEALEGLEEGDTKRRKIGELFIRTFEKIADEQDVATLIHGTIAPDTIESTRGMASKGSGHNHGGMIKLHHNVGGLPTEMWIQNLEPIKELFKYQVRILGRALDIPEEMLERQPFPGPGLSVRIPGGVERPTVELLRRATKMVEDALRPYGPAQYLAYFVDRGIQPNARAIQIVKDMLGDSFSVLAKTHGEVAVGVKGDERALGKILSLSLSRNGEIAWHHIPWLDLLRLQSMITGRIQDVCRVAALVAEGQEGDLTAVVRAVDTRDFMTAMPTGIPFERLYGLGDELIELPRIGAVSYEITTKPSSTIELE